MTTSDKVVNIIFMAFCQTVTILKKKKKNEKTEANRVCKVMTNLDKTTFKLKMVSLS